MNGQIVKNASINSKIVTIEDSLVEWKNVQALLTKMGLQLIPTSKKPKIGGNIINAIRKMGNREL